MGGLVDLKERREIIKGGDGWRERENIYLGLCR